MTSRREWFQGLGINRAQYKCALHDYGTSRRIVDYEEGVVRNTRSHGGGWSSYLLAERLLSSLNTRMLNSPRLPSNGRDSLMIPQLFDLLPSQLEGHILNG